MKEKCTIRNSNPSLKYIQDVNETLAQLTNSYGDQQAKYARENLYFTHVLLKQGQRLDNS